MDPPLNEEDPFSCFGSDRDDKDEDAEDDETDVPAITASVDLARRLVRETNARRHDVTGGAPTHLPLCSLDFEVSEDLPASPSPSGKAAPSRGKGLRSLKRYACGEEIVREAAAMRVPNRQAASSLKEAEAMHARAVQNSFDSLHPETQRAVMDLSSCGSFLESDEGVLTPLGVYQTNSFKLGDEAYGGLFLTIARINHSCRPNSNHIWRPDLQKTVVFASRDIEIGDEICTTYGPSECLDTAGRRSFLQETFSFDCMCDMCVEGNSKGGDDRMIELNSLQEDISMLAASNKGEAAIQNIDRCLALMEEQDIGNGVFISPLLHYGYLVSCSGLQDDDLARSYLSRELMVISNCEGVGSPKAIKIQRLLTGMSSQ